MRTERTFMDHPRRNNGHSREGRTGLEASPGGSERRVPAEGRPVHGWRFAMNESRKAGNGMSATQATGWLRDHSSRIMTAGIILALLYLARSVLIPLALAIMLSLLVAPLIRALRRLRIGRAFSVLVAVAALTVSCVGIAATLGTQILHIAESLPQYESNVERKLKTLEEATVGPILRLTNETSRLTGIHQSAEPPHPARHVERSPPAAVPGVAVLPSPEFESHPLQLIWRLLTTIWH